jgi:hypothetical protein
MAKSGVRAGRVAFLATPLHRDGSTALSLGQTRVSSRPRRDASAFPTRVLRSTDSYLSHPTRLGSFNMEKETGTGRNRRREMAVVK